jgi:hypothetical protein
VCRMNLAEIFRAAALYMKKHGSKAENVTHQFQVTYVFACGKSEAYKTSMNHQIGSLRGRGD